MNPDQPAATPNPPTTPPATPTQPPKAGWKNRPSSLNGPQRLLLLVAIVMATLVATAATYQAFFQKETAVTPTTAPATASVSITKNGLTPATITIKAGTQLTWANADTKAHQPAADPHPLDNSIEGFESDTTLLPKDSLAFTFENPGTYTYHDHLNPLDKRYFGTVAVE